MNIAILVVLLTAGTLAAQPTPTSAPASHKALLSAMVLHSRQCHSNSHKCRDVCEAANTLERDAIDLAMCAAKHDYADDCSAQASEVRDSADGYETAVSDADNDCD